MPLPKELDELLDAVYGSHVERAASLIRKYATLYQLPELSRDWPVNHLFFIHAARSLVFVLVALYNEKKEFLIINSPTELSPGEPVGWRLLGGPIHTQKSESIEEAVNRVVKREVGLDVAELEPIAQVENSFISNTGTTKHIGLAFIARAYGQMNAPRHAEWRFALEAPDKMAFLNREVFLLAVKRLKEKYFDPPMEEVEGRRRHRWRAALHRFLIKPLTYWFASKPLKRRIKAFIAEPHSVLDASAGDDELILEIAGQHSPEVCVANDIAWAEMSGIRAKARHRALNILFTNHNVSELPFKRRFDVVIYKNSMHHAHTKAELVATLEGLRGLARRLIVVDIEQPRRSRLGWWFHLYYWYFCGDEGRDFFTRETFQGALRLIFKDATKEHSEHIHTIKGVYMIGVFDFAD